MKFISQLDARDCGATCLAMIARYYAHKYHTEAIRERFNINTEGVSVLAISKVAESIGFKTIGGLISFSALSSANRLPCIIHWDQNHFVVVYKISKTWKGQYQIHVADPGKGLLVYNQIEFTQHWISTKSNGEEKGVALLLQPMEAFYNQSNEDSTGVTGNRFRFLWRYMRTYQSYFLLLILGLVLGALLQLVFPFLTQSIVDTGIGAKDISFIWVVLLAQAMLLLSRTAIDFIRNKILLHISTRINISLVSDFFIKLMKLPMRFSTRNF